MCRAMANAENDPHGAVPYADTDAVPLSPPTSCPLWIRSYRKLKTEIPVNLTLASIRQSGVPFFWEFHVVA
jgi:hypothetical protein